MTLDLTKFRQRQRVQLSDAQYSLFIIFYLIHRYYQKLLCLKYMLSDTEH